MPISTMPDQYVTGSMASRRATKLLARSVAPALNALRRGLPPLERRRGVLFVGYAEGDLGLGEAFRANVAAAVQSGVIVGIYPFHVGVETRRIRPFMQERYDTTHAFDINVVAVAPDQVPAMFRTLDPRLLNRSYNILSTFWELPHAPKSWRRMLSGFDELWVPNIFVADALREIFPRKITIIPPAIHCDDRPVNRSTYGMKPDRFYFLFSFDYFSSPHRKNPMAVLQAFQEAFPDRASDVGLVIKSIGAPEHFPEIKRIFLDTAKHDSRIIVIDRSLSRDEMLDLVRASNAYVSLHRSEGFGMGMAEAMSCGRVVIGTNFSGSTCFLTEETGFPVPYALRTIEPWEYRWAATQVWAEPDVRAAAEIMRLVIDRPDLADERALAGKSLMRVNFGLEVVGGLIAQRVATIQASIGERDQCSA